MSRSHCRESSPIRHAYRHSLYLVIPHDVYRTFEIRVLCDVIQVLKLSMKLHMKSGSRKVKLKGHSSRTVMETGHMNGGIRSGFMLFGFMLIVVEMKFTAPRMDDTPLKCREKMARSIDAAACAILLARGGKTLHPVLAPLSTVLLASSSVRDERRNQKSYVVYSWTTCVRHMWWFIQWRYKVFGGLAKYARRLLQSAG